VDNDDEDGGSSVPSSRGMYDFSASREEQMAVPNPWEVPLPSDAPPEAKDPRFDANVPPIWVKRVPMAGKVIERAETAGLAIFGHRRYIQ